MFPSADPVVDAAAADAKALAALATAVLPDSEEEESAYFLQLEKEKEEQVAMNILWSTDGAIEATACPIAHFLNITMGLETVDSDVDSVSVDSDDKTCHSDPYTPLLPLADLAAEWLEEQRLKLHVAAIHQGLEIKWASIKEEPLMAAASLVKDYGGY